MKLPRILISAASSGSGKTLLTCGILQALKNRGVRAASFKCGPDYIDPMFHTRVLGTKSRNLDTFFVKPDTARYLLAENAADCDIAVIEGVMGYYDGLAGISVQGSAYDVARVTDTPAVLIVNCRGMSVSIVPQILGFLKYQEESMICGVILNRISAMLYPRVKQMIEEQLPVKVLGYVPELSDCVLESRHLGLVLPGKPGGRTVPRKAGCGSGNVSRHGRAAYSGFGGRRAPLGGAEAARTGQQRQARARRRGARRSVLLPV